MISIIVEFLQKNKFANFVCFIINFKNKLHKKMLRLPQDVVVEICGLLDLNDLMNLRLVSQNFKNVASSEIVMINLVSKMQESSGIGNY